MKNPGRGRSVEEPEHPAWKAWLEYSGHVPGTTMGIDSAWDYFKAGWEALADDARQWLDKYHDSNQPPK